jgi:hypothetical protein
MAKIVFFVGLVLLGLTLLTLIIGAIMPEVTDGKASYRESFPVIAIGSGCSCISYLILAVGGILLVMAGRKKPDGPGPKA